MSSYWSTLLTTTTSRVASIRQNLLSSENDGDTEDDTHLCRVLRSYYTEKGRSFPAWLPPDPRAPPPTNLQPVYAQSNAGSRYGGNGSQTVASTSFASLFGNGNNEQQPITQETQSLRQGRAQTRLGQDPMSIDRSNSYSKIQAVTEAPIVQSRPLPSKMAGSYQTANIGMRGSNQAGNLSGQPMSAKDRLRAGNLRRPDPRTSHSTESFSYNTISNEKSEKPFVAATSPWASNEQEFGGAGYNPPPRNKPPGFPGGPVSGRRLGLPSGPRGPR